MARLYGKDVTSSQIVGTLLEYEGTLVPVKHSDHYTVPVLFVDRPVYYDTQVITEVDVENLMTYRLLHDDPAHVVTEEIVVPFRQCMLHQLRSEIYALNLFDRNGEIWDEV